MDKGVAAAGAGVKETDVQMVQLVLVLKGGTLVMLAWKVGGQF